MGTRGFAGFVINGDLKISYNHSDSYPSWLGDRVLKWAKSATAPEVIEATRTAAAGVVLVDQDETPTAGQQEALKGFADTHIGFGRTDDWYVLLRETQGDLDATLRAGFMLDGTGFPADSLFCEWGYLVDLDAQTFEVYRGFVEGRAVGRFADMETEGNGYGPVTLIASWPLDELPDELDEEALASSGTGN